jgi:preprotein translocase subunit YajC
VKFLPYVIVGIIFVVLIGMMQRNRRRQVAAETARSEQIAAGTEVMTTSGLYGTVVAKNDDGTVLLSIAPGVEVRWAIAALRDAASLSDRYRGAIGSQGEDDPDAPEDSAEDDSPRNSGPDGSVRLDKSDHPGAGSRAGEDGSTGVGSGG